MRAGLVSDPADYSWSSYVAHAFGLDTQLWHPHTEYEQLGATPGERQKTYRQLFVEDLGEEVLSDIRSAVQSGFVLGNDQFRSQVEQLTGIPQFYRKRGRRPARD